MSKKRKEKKRKKYPQGWLAHGDISVYNEEVKTRRKNQEDKTHEKEKAEKNISYKKFIDEIFWIINILPRTCEIKNLYWEKGGVILEGKSQNIEEIFKFMTKLEKDKRIENINFDSILEKDKNYEFVIEMRVENGGA